MPQTFAFIILEIMYNAISCEVFIIYHIIPLRGPAKQIEHGMMHLFYEDIFAFLATGFEGGSRRHVPLQ